MSRSTTRPSDKLTVTQISIQEPDVEDVESPALPDRTFDARVVALLVVVGGVVPVLIAAHFGALGIPRNGDDWSYLLTLFRFAEHGELNGNHWVSMNLVGQIVLGALPIVVLGQRIAVAQLETVVVGVAGLFAVYDLGTRITTRRLALLVAALVAVGPMWATYAVSYMTDVWFLALGAICLALGARAVDTSETRTRILVASVAVGFVAFTIREYAIVAPISVIAVAVWREPPGSRTNSRAVRWAVGLLVSLAVAAAVFEAWRRSLPSFTPNLSPSAPSVESLRMSGHVAGQLMLSVGLVVSPAVVAAGPIGTVRRAWRSGRWLTALTIGVVAIPLAREIHRLQQSAAYFWAPFLQPLHQGPTGPDLLPKSVSFSLAVVGLLAMTLLFLTAVPAVASLRQRTRPPRPVRPAVAMVASTTLAVSGLYFVALACGIDVWDRYVLPLVPLVALLAVSHPQPGTRRRSIGTGLVFLLVAAFGLLYTATTASRDGTAWQVAEDATAIAHDPSKVAWNDDWAFYHAGGIDVHGLTTCIVVQAEPSPVTAGNNQILALREAWTPWGTSTWYVARLLVPC